MTTEVTGWIPYEDRNDFQKRMSDNFIEQTPAFGEIVNVTNRPETALLYTLEKQVTGGLLNRYGQFDGSCVGVGWARAATQSMCGDFAHRGTNEVITDLFPFATWGVSRRLAGLNSRGAGSYGAAMAKAGQTFGMLAANNPLIPRFSLKDGNWIAYSGDVELDWSVPRQWPVKESELAPIAEQTQVIYVARIRNVEELKDAISQGRGVTIASMFGTSPRVVDGVLTGEWNRRWAHQMSIGGYFKHPTNGRTMYAIDNQWWKNAHGACPFLSQMGVYGSFSISESTMTEILNSSGAECFAHGDTEDFGVRVINWDSMGMG